VPHEQLVPFTLELAERIAHTQAVGETLDLYARGEDLTLAAALALETSHSVGRKYDLAAFTAAGSRTAARQRERKSASTSTSTKEPSA